VKFSQKTFFSFS